MRTYQRSIDDGARLRGRSIAAVLKLCNLVFDFALTIQGSAALRDGPKGVRKMTWVNREMA
jgi:hypothetical protein